MKYLLPFLALTATLFLCLQCFGQSISIPALAPTTSMVPPVTNFGPTPTNLVGIHPTPKPLNLSNIVWQAYPAAFQFSILQTSTDLVWWADVQCEPLDGKWRTNSLPVTSQRYYRITYGPMGTNIYISNGVSATVSNSVKVR